MSEFLDAVSLVILGAGTLTLCAFSIADFARAWREGNGGEP